MKVRFPLAPAVLALFAGFASAQTTFPEYEGPALDWTTHGISGPIGRAEACELTGDKHLDYVARSGSGLSMFYAPMLHDHVHEVPLTPELTAVNDFDVLEGTGPGGRDELIAVGLEGAYRITYDRSLGGYLRSKVGNSSWEDAQHVEAGDVNHDGTVDVIGVDATGDLLVQIGPLTDGVPPSNVIAIGLPIADLAILDWTDADSPDLLEVAIALPGIGIAVYSTTGVPLHVFQIPFTSPKLEVFRQDGYDHDRLATLYNLSGRQYLGVVHEPSYNEVPQDVGAAGTYLGLTAGNIDGDVDDDLLLAESGKSGAWIFDNTSNGADPPPATTFVQSEYVNTATFGSSLSAQEGDPVLADYDRDGDLDLLITFSMNETWLRVMANTNVDASLGKPTVFGGQYDFVSPPGRGELKLRTSDPRPTYPATHLEVVGWTVVDPNPENEYLDSTAKISEYVPIDDVITGDGIVIVPESSMVTEHLYYLELTFVELDGQEELITAAPTSVVLFTSNSDTSEWLEDHPVFSFIKMKGLHNAVEVPEDDDEYDPDAGDDPDDRIPPPTPGGDDPPNPDGGGI